MLDSVIAKIEAQQKGKEGTAAFMVGEQLKDICRNNPAAAELVDKDLDVPEMSIDCAEKKIKEYADKQKKVNNCVCVPPDAAEKIIREFYGLPERGNESASSSSGAGFIDLSNFL